MYHHRVIKFGMGTFAFSLAFVVIVSGCSKRSSESQLLDACVSGLSSRLKTWAKYDGWKTETAKATLYKMEPDLAKTKKYKTNQFYDFKVLISGFTVKNGFNADVKSLSMCTGYVSKNSNGNYDPPDDISLKFTLNGQKLGL